MTRRALIPVIASLALLTTVGAASCHHRASKGSSSRLETASAIPAPRYAALLDQIAAARFPSDLETTRADLGASAEGRPLVVFTLTARSRPSAPAPSLSILITEAIHGNEYLGIAPRLWTDLFTTDASVRSFLKAGGQIHYIPVVNPDGYERTAKRLDAGDDRRALTLAADVLRSNAEGFDLNRAFIDDPPLAAEAKLLARWLRDQFQSKERRLALAVNHHCCEGTFMYGPFSETRYEGGLSADAVRLTHLVGPSATRATSYDFAHGPTLAKYAAAGTFDDFVSAELNALSLTLEGMPGVEPSRYERHATWWRDVMAVMAGWQLTGALPTEGAPARPFSRIAPSLDLGADLVPPFDIADYISIETVVARGAFALAGARADDRLVTVDGQQVFRPAEVQRLIRMAKDDRRDQVPITISRPRSGIETLFSTREHVTMTLQLRLSAVR